MSTTTTKADLHSHTYYSDGVLSPDELILRAQEHHVTHLAITDHDTVAAYANFQAIDSIKIIPGIELSCDWRGQTIHIVGLNISLDNPQLTEAIAWNQAQREQRAKAICQKLPKIGLSKTYESMYQYPGMSVGRLHFAKMLIKQGKVSKIQQAFKQFLLRGKPLYVPVNWISLQQAVTAINAAGGVAVIAHPRRYNFTFTKLKMLAAEFKEYGGQAIEVVTTSHNRDDMFLCSTIAKEFDLAGSMGTDFHHPAPFRELGRLPALPEETKSVLSLLI